MLVGISWGASMSGRINGQVVSYFLVLVTWRGRGIDLGLGDGEEPLPHIKNPVCLYLHWLLSKL
jgi:hypothetical protein